MRRTFFILSIIFVLVLAGVGAVIYAQERHEQKIELPAGMEMVVLGGLKLKEGADPEAAEKLFKENLIPAMEGKDGFQMKILKAMKMPNETPDPNAPDYIMLAELQKPEVLMQLMQGGNSKLSEFGDMMKPLAGSPQIKMYTVITKTGKEEKE